jgi:hypothetical protein
MPRTMYATAETTIGVAIEPTRGEAVDPAFWMKTKEPKYDPDLTLIADDTLQGSMVATYNLVPGLRYDSHGWDSYPYLDSFPLLVRAELGSADTVGTAPGNTTLAAAASVGATTISVDGAVTAPAWVVIGSGSTLETHKITASSGSASPYTLTLATPLIFPQAAGATVTGLTSHTFSLLNSAGDGNQPPSVTITDYDGETWRQLAAAQLDKLTIKGNADGFVDYTCSWFANPAQSPTTPPSPAYTTTQAVPGWSTVIQLGGSQIVDVEEWNVDLERGVKPIPAFLGTQEYFQYFAGPLTPTASITVIEQSGAPELTAYLTGVNQSLDITFFDRGTGNAMNIHSTQSMFKTGSLDRSKEYVEAKLDIDLLPSPQDATAGGVSPVVITIANLQTTSY